MTSLLLAALFACGGPGGTELRDAPPVVIATDVWTVKLDAKMPTDLLALPDGGFVVLDGYEEHAFTFDSTHHLSSTIDGGGTWGRPIRAALARGGGMWLSSPEGHLVIKVDEQGKVTSEFPVGTPTEQLQPIAVLESDAGLFISDRQAQLHLLDPKDGHQLSVITQDAEAEAFSVIGDLTAGPEGGFWAVDTLASRVGRFDSTGKPVSRFGKYGIWVGSLRKPTSIAEGPSNSLLVADSGLSTIQLYDGEGHTMGILQVDGQPFRPDFPVAVRSLGGGNFAVLQAAPGKAATVVGFHLDTASIDVAREESASRWLRAPLVEAIANPAKECVQCHAGIVNDSREIWDTSLGHHPVNVVPDRTLPAFFPLKDGKIVCITCHSPHGTSTLSEVEGVTNEAGRATLVPHKADTGDAFTRMRRGDSALCVACHDTDAHDAALARHDLASGKAHPVGTKLAELLAKREEAGEKHVAECLGCHAVHGADEDGLPRGEDDRELCGACHSDRLESGVNHSVGERPRQNRSPRAGSGIPTQGSGSPACRSCHEMIGGRTDALIRTPTDGGSLCLTCHQDLAAPMKRAHGAAPTRLNEPCLACHEPHAGKGEHLLARLGTLPGDATGCLRCHGAGGAAVKAGVSPGTKGHVVDARTSKMGPLTCRTCHDQHEPLPPKVSCGECHTDQQAAADRGGHGSAECLDCHPMHTDAARLAKGVNPSSARCLACHGPDGSFPRAPRVNAYEHPAPILTPGGARWTPLAGLPLYDDAGQEAGEGRNGALVCRSCHLVHGPDATTAGDKLRRPDWQAACSSCHGEDALVLYRWFHQPDRRADFEGSSP